MQKKLVKLLVSLVTCFSVFTLVAFSDTTHENSDTITYNDKEYNKSELSQETIEWLERYNSLPSDLQDMVNHVPVELRTPVPYSSIGTIDANVPDPDYTPPSLLEDLLPTGGSEPVYNPDFWNAPENIKRANCYAYAMDVIQSFEGKLQPGQLSGHEYTSLTEDSIITAVKNDGPYLGTGRGIRKVSKNTRPMPKEYKVALVIAPDFDYHWYIQNSNGYWSHKRGSNKVSDLDASDNKIVDPETCDRNYGGSFNYSTFCGYYMVSRR